ncbi:MAG: selenide, water dikinase SelD [Candidatus Thorarchaeota archaeon]|nr:selenide, water dikinase SelD [Candidatus Thorarchaeota archaeon]
MGTVRFSVGRGTTSKKIEKAIDTVSSTVKRLQPAAGDVHIPESEEKETYKLTRYTHGMGCACKLRPQALEQVLRTLPVPTDKNILVGIETADDAAVYRLNDDMAIVQTVDFFTPIVDEAYWFGAISAANSLSDIYAMGARPILGVNIAGFPSNRLPLSVLEEILKGAQEKAAEAGISVIGGHTVEDTEPKYGLAVTGIVHPDEVVRNSTAKPGDVLVLTKPIGLGIISTAVKRGLADDKTRKIARNLMASLNRKAAEAMTEVGVNACTDITGFGLLGHLREMAAGSKVDVSISASAVPIIEVARQLAGADVIPGGTKNNLGHVKPHLDVTDGVSQIDLYLLADAQTSGGLLISIPESLVDELMAQLNKKGIEQATIIGSITDEGSGRITINT